MPRTAPASATVRNSAARTERAEDRPTAPALAVTPTLTPTVTGALSTPLTSLPVIHQHRLGSCRGRLTVTREGVEFIPDARSEGDDAFKLKYKHLLPVLAGGNLTIRSPERAYRFKAAGGEAGKDDDRLERLVASMTQFR
jgi:hypothetical protein